MFYKLKTDIFFINYKIYMCGIFGCIKNVNKDLNVQKILIDVLTLLKNRGYDSCGVYLKSVNNSYYYKLGVDGNEIQTKKIDDIFKYLKRKMYELQENYYIGFGHTRWATHGGKTDENSHPHKSMNGDITLIHNGIISNYEILKKKYLDKFVFKSSTDTEVIVNMIQHFRTIYKNESFINILKFVTNELVGTWACIIFNKNENNRLYFIKNGNPLLIAKADNYIMLSSETSGFMNMTEKYILLRDNTIGYVEYNNIFIDGDYKELELIKLNNTDIELSKKYNHWMRKEIEEQYNLQILKEPITNEERIIDNTILFNFDFIKECKYLYIIGCGSSYYAGLIASNYFRFTKAFEFVNVFDAGDFNKSLLENIENPEKDLLIVIISQSGETKDIDNCINICREYSSNRKNKLKSNMLLKNIDPKEYLLNEKIELKDYTELGEIKILGIINVIGSLLSRRTISNIYTNVGRENSVGATKSTTAQIMACLLLAIYKSNLNNKLEEKLKIKFFNDLNNLQNDILKIIEMEDKIKSVALSIHKLLKNNNTNSLFLLGCDELYGSSLEGALKLKEISTCHAEAYLISSLKHGPYALLNENSIVIISYKSKNHFVKSVISEIVARKGIVFEISCNADNNDNNIIIPDNKTMTGLLVVIVYQLLSYHIGILKNNNIDCPKNLAKTCTTD